MSIKLNDSLLSTSGQESKLFGTDLPLQQPPVSPPSDNQPLQSVITYKKGEKKTYSLVPTVKRANGGKVGFGAYGDVYIHRNNSQLVVKKSKSDLTDEFEIGHRLHHRCLTKATQLFIKLYPNIRPTFKLVMERIEGSQLFDRLLGKAPRLGKEAVLQLLEDAKETVRYLFDNKVVWADLSLVNIFLTQQKHLKCCDFGWWYEEQNTLIRTQRLLLGAMEFVTSICLCLKLETNEIQKIMCPPPIFIIPCETTPFIFPRCRGPLPDEVQNSNWMQEITKKLKSVSDEGKKHFLEDYIDRVIESFRICTLPT